MAILGLIHASMVGRPVFIRYKASRQDQVNHDNQTNRKRKRRWFIQISALSTFDGRIEAYHGFNG